MPEITTCPDCDKKLKVPDHLIGKKVRCPGCSVMFVARADEEEEVPASRASGRAPQSDAISERRKAPARDEDDRPRSRSRDDDDDRPRSRSRDEDRDDRDDRIRRRDDHDEDYPPPRSGDPAKGWRGTRLGITLVAVSNWLFLSCIGVALIGAGIMLLLGGSLISSVVGGGTIDESSASRGVAGAAGAAIGMIIFLALVGLLYFASYVLQLVGFGLCMQVPNRRDSSAMRILAIVTFCCAAAAFLLSFLGAAIGRGNSLGTVSSLLSLAAFICWIIFLRLVAIECRAPDLGSRLIIYMISIIVYYFVAVTMAVIALCAGGAAMLGTSSAGGASAVGIIVLIVLGLILLVGVGLLVWYGLLLQQMRDQIARHLGRV